MATLNEKQKQFIDEYFICGFNGTEAYRRTYPEGQKYAQANAAKLKAKPHIKAEIERRLNEIVGDREELAKQMLYKLRDVAFEDKLSEEVPLSAQLKATELLGKQLSLYTQKVEGKVDIGGCIEINIVDDENDTDTN